MQPAGIAYPSVSTAPHNGFALKETGNTGDISEYHGPSTNQYPFRAIRLLGVSQLLVALLIHLVTIVQLSLGYGDRYIFLMSAAVNLWTPFPAIAAGIVGIRTSERRYWEAQCMKVAYFILSILSAVFMLILLGVVASVGAYYFGLSDAPRASDVYPLPASVVQHFDNVAFDKADTHKALLGAYICLALVLLIVSCVAVVVTCCCAPTYKLKDKALKRRLVGSHNPHIRRCDDTSDPSVPGAVYSNRGRAVGGVKLSHRDTIQPQPPPPPHNLPVYGSFVQNSVYHTNTPHTLMMAQ